MELAEEELIHEIAVGVLEKEWSEIEKKLTAAKGFAKTIHVDLLDGKFAQNTSFQDPKPFEAFSKDLFLELHMMVEDPIKYVEPFGKAGFQRFIGHIEKMPNISEFIALAQVYGEVGLAIDGPTDIEVLEKVNLEDLDCVLIYTCEKVGFAGPPFDPNKLTKVRALRERTQIPIEVDGGMKDTTILFARNAGANRFVATSFIWGSENPKEAYEKLVREVTS
ncbi:MAG: ribulose-phosphate 3-epimerase [Candidatus Levyibacteriota bacterium]